MIDFTKIGKGTLLKYACKARNDEIEKPLKNCEVVHIFKAYQVPKKKKIIKYYGKEIIDPVYGKLFGPMKNDRFVLKRGKGDYIVLHCHIKTLHYVNLEIIKY